MAEATHHRPIPEEPRREQPVDDPILELDGVSKRYSDDCAVEDCSFAVEEGELLTLLGPSGCGKTTTLRLIAGLERPDNGVVRIADEPVTGDGRFVPPEAREVGIVFQNFALFPHLTAAENIGFGLQDWSREERDARVAELLELVGLTDHADSDPDDLSGGQQQRIALARSLAPEPEILLLDEPFSNLDADLRIEMREEVRSILKEAGVTAISVTHDQEEALSISDRLAVMYDGQIEQVGRPEAVFQRPRSRFVAGFLGNASFLSGYVGADAVETELGAFDSDRVHGLADEYRGSRIDVLVRPDDVAAFAVDEDEANGRLVQRRYLGSTVLYRVELDNGDAVECMHNHADELPLDSPVAVQLVADHGLAWFPADHRE